MSKKNAKKTQSPIPRKVGDVPVTMRHLELVKQELKSDITTLRLETKSGFTKMEADMSLFKTDISAAMSLFKTDISAAMSIFKTDISASMSQVKSAVFQMQALLEEQNSRNHVALDGYATVYEKQTTIEDRVGKLEKKVFGAEHE